ncbi:NAD-binding protein [Croceicoccus marinus]|uniref:RCK N-terminal domain-containing protein n=1 Tax=Croceicoccus marinus TaxID=450378 RepID=A0A217EYM2_9SPHN|nr:NAD(P)-binding protein [Croceicoccus marinus]ARU18221.1 hypothetical protein A9D14_17815 [Croceicoccus marinus]
MIIGGFGRIGHLLADLLDAQRISYVALDTDGEIIARQRAKGMPVVVGDATQPDLLPHLGIERAAAFVSTMDAPGSAEHVVGAAHQLWPHVPIYARAQDAEHARRLQALGASGRVPDTVEASLQLCEELLTGIGFPEEAARAIVNERRRSICGANRLSRFRATRRANWSRRDTVKERIRTHGVIPSVFKRLCQASNESAVHAAGRENEKSSGGWFGKCDA